MTSLAAKLRVGGEATRIVVDALTAPVTGDRDRHPRSAKALTRSWLTRVLCADTPGVHVTSVRLGDANNGTTSRQPFTVTYNEPGGAAGLPTNPFAKFTDRLRSRLLLGPVGAVRNEAEFYRRVRPNLDLVAPHGYHVSYEGRSWRSIFVLEDVGAERDASFCDAKQFVDRAAAESMMRNLAALHAAYWDSERLDADHPWLQTFARMQLLFNYVAAFEKRSLIGFDRAGERLPATLRARRREVYPAAMRSMQLNTYGPQTFLHNDPHIGNWFRASGGEMGLYDWQATVRGSWASDVSYALASALSIEDRRAWERELLELYLGELSMRVATPPSFAEAWLAYRQQIFHALIYWLFTLGQGPLQPPMQPRDVTEIVVERVGHAVADLDAFAAVTA